MKKLISFWKQVREKSSDMFTLFRVGIGVKVPTHKLHVKDKTDPLKIEGLQNDATDPDKYLSIDSSNIIKYRTGAQLFAAIATTYVHTQGSSSAAWVVTHNLDKFPSATVVDSAGTVVIGVVTYDSLNQVTLTFKATFSGKAYFN